MEAKVILSELKSWLVFVVVVVVLVALVDLIGPNSTCMSNVSLVFSCSISLATTRTTTKEEKNKKRDSSYTIARLACFYYSGKGNITTVLVS